jgi:hypothetical protein
MDNGGHRIGRRFPSVGWLLRSAPDATRLERIYHEVIAALEFYGETVPAITRAGHADPPGWLD